VTSLAIATALAKAPGSLIQSPNAQALRNTSPGSQNKRNDSDQLNNEIISIKKLELYFVNIKMGNVDLMNDSERINVCNLHAEIS
jgi:hypothetical protein